MTFVKSQARSGFSLIELMVVIGIMALLAAFVGPAVYNYFAKANLRTAQTQLRVISQAIDSYERDMGDYPQKLSDLVIRPRDPEKAQMWMGGIIPKKGGYLERIPKDPWKHPYVYRPEPYKGNPYTLYSRGSKETGRIEAPK